MEHPSAQPPLERYVILDYLAEGGMGAIYHGKKLGMSGFEKDVVLKQLLPEYTENPEFIDLFLREARLSASLDHANIVHTIDLVTSGKDYFIVMEYVRGGDLRTISKRAKRRGRPWHPAAALYVGREILQALSYAHAKRAPDGSPLYLIHRDVSPSNILLSHSGEVKLTDFGIAKASTHNSVLYKVKGKIGYMSPEQARGQVLDHRSDLFSCAVCIYEILVGERLFVGDITMTPAQIYSQPIARPSDKRPGLPRDLDAVFGKALCTEPEGRFSSSAEFSEAVRNIATKCGLVFGAADLAAHLREVAGEDVSSWMKPYDEKLEFSRPGTEVVEGFASRPAPSQFAGKALTSILAPIETHEAAHANPETQPPTAAAKRSARGALPGASPGDPAGVHQPPRTWVPSLPSAGKSRLFQVSLGVVLLGVGIAAVVGLSRPNLPKAATELSGPPTVDSANATGPASASSAPPVARPASAIQEVGGDGPGRMLEVDSSPSGASVRLSERVRCTTPCRIHGLSAERVYHLQVLRDGYVPWSSLVDLQDPGSQPLTALLRPIPEDDKVGYIKVASTPTAEIYLNGKEIGAVTNEGPLPIRPGTYELAIVHPRIQARRQVLVTVTARQTTPVSMSLK